MARRFREVREVSEAEKLRELEAEKMRLMERERQQEREILIAAENLRYIGDEERRILEMTKNLYDERARLSRDEYKVREDEIEQLKDDLRANQRGELTIDNECVHAIATGYATFGNKTSAKFEEQMERVLGSKLEELRNWVDGTGEIHRGLAEDPFPDEEIKEELGVNGADEIDMEALSFDEMDIDLDLLAEDRDDQEIDIEALSFDEIDMDELVEESQDFDLNFDEDYIIDDPDKGVEQASEFERGGLA